jgi:hypothetical protein
MICRVTRLKFGVRDVRLDLPPNTPVNVKNPAKYAIERQGKRKLHEPFCRSASNYKGWLRKQPAGMKAGTHHEKDRRPKRQILISTARVSAPRIEADRRENS